MRNYRYAIVGEGQATIRADGMKIENGYVLLYTYSDDHQSHYDARMVLPLRHLLFIEETAP